MKYRIDCASIHSADEFHRVLAEAMAFPDWYGSNLDALYDCLTAISSETHLTLLNWDPAEAYAPVFCQVLADAAWDNPSFSVSFQ